MKNREQGSTTVTAFSVLVALGVVTAFVERSMRSTMSMKNDLQHQRAVEDGQLAAMSVLAKMKGMMSERKNGTGEYMPAIYAKNYFSTEWDLKNYDKLNYGVKNAEAKGKSTTLDALAVHSVNKASQVMDGNSQLKVGSMPLTIELDRVEHKGKVFAFVPTVDVTVSGSYQADDGSKKEVRTRARITLPTPLPRNPILEVAPKGSNAWTTNLAGMSAGGEWQIRAKASGIVYKAKLYDNGSLAHEWGGFDPKTGRILHNAVSYDSTDVVLGAPVTVNLSESAAGASDDAGSLNADCKFVPPAAAIGGKHSYQLVVEGVDGESEVKTNPVEFTVSATAAGLGRDPTQNEYMTMCVGPKECPYINDNSTADEIKVRVDSGHMGDLSSIWTKNEATSVHTEDTGAVVAGYNVGYRKLCINFDKVKSLPKSVHFAEAELFLYDLPSCKRKKLGNRTSCGCVTGDSLVLMGDGRTEKKISELADDDLIWNPLTKKAYALRTLTVGPEKDKPLLVIRAAGRSIRATGNHPFLLQGGRTVRAMELNAGDVLQGPEGTMMMIDAVTVEHPGKDAPVVWNLELEAPNHDLDAHNVQINGIITGDLLIQKMLQGSVAER